MDNGRTKVMLEFDASDLPMLAEALGLARNTAMMNGQPVAQKRLETLRKMVDAMIPAGARIFDGEVWSEICLAMYNGDDWDVSIHRPSWRPQWSKDGYILVSVGDKAWHSRDSDYHVDSDSLAAVEGLLREMEPLRPAMSSP